MIPTLYKHSLPGLFRDLSHLHRELDQFFSRPDFQGFAPFQNFGLLEGDWSPRVNVHEDKENIHVVAELPGMKKESMDLFVQGDTLILKGERRQELDEKKGNYHRVERVYGQFHRAIGLPSSVDPARVKASYKNGVLEVVLPKKEETQTRPITVEVK